MERFCDFIGALINGVNPDRYNYIGLAIDDQERQIGDYLPLGRGLRGTPAIWVSYDCGMDEILDVCDGLKRLAADLNLGERIVLIGGDNMFEYITDNVVIEPAQILHIFTDEWLPWVVNVEVFTLGPTITTEEIGAINRLASKIRAISEKGALTIDYDERYSNRANHEDAAKRLAEEHFLHPENLIWLGGRTSTGYVFVNTSKSMLQGIVNAVTRNENNYALS